ncbi:MAG: alpha-L-arabinofuranosidase C-terminal domain-containing protein [Candidatus Limnocylindrales bacterium]
MPVHGTLAGAAVTLHRISVDLDRRIGAIDPNVFGGFVEHLGRCVYGGIHEPGSSKAGPDGLRTDVLEAARRLRYSNIRYPGGNFVSAYRWRDGVGPVDERPARYEPAWDAVEPNTFGTNEFIAWCRRLGAEPYLVVNAGDGEMREARDWVEYCNGTKPTAPVRLRQEHGFPEPHQVRYWGIGNEVDGPWQVGYKTPEEYARTYLEFAKVMRWADPSIKLVASAVSHWEGKPLERIALLLEQAAQHIDYLGIHWYVGNPVGDVPAYLAVSELIEERLGIIEGLALATTLRRPPQEPIPIAVDEWNVWYKAPHDPRDPAFNQLEETYDLADALVVAMHFNAFFRHARSVRMANLAQLVNVIAPMTATTDDLLLQTTFYPFELYAQLAGSEALDVLWGGDTYSARRIDDNFNRRPTAGERTGIRVLDVSATVDDSARRVTVFVVNRDLEGPREVEVSIVPARPGSDVEVHSITGAHPGAVNTFADREAVTRTSARRSFGDGPVFVAELPAHSVNALVFTV